VHERSQVTAAPAVRPYAHTAHCGRLHRSSGNGQLHLERPGDPPDTAVVLDDSLHQAALIRREGALPHLVGDGTNQIRAPEHLGSIPVTVLRECMHRGRGIQGRLTWYVPLSSVMVTLTSVSLPSIVALQVKVPPFLTAWSAGQLTLVTLVTL